MIRLTSFLWVWFQCVCPLMPSCIGPNPACPKKRTSLVARMVKHLSTMWETRVRSLGQEGSLEKEIYTLCPLYILNTSPWSDVCYDCFLPVCLWLAFSLSWWCCYFFLKCLVESISEAIWVWSLYKILNYRLNEQNEIGFALLTSVSVVIFKGYFSFPLSCLIY